MVGSMMLMKILHCKRERIRKKNFANSFAQGTSQDHGDNFTKVSIKRESLSYETCRICLKEGKLPIFSGATEETSKSIKEIAGVEVSADDPHPKCLCQPCHALLRGAILLRRTAQQSDRILKQPIKPEPRSDTDESIEANDNMVTEEDLKTKTRMLKEPIELPEPRSDSDESIDADEGMDIVENVKKPVNLKTTNHNKSENKLKYGLTWECHKCEREFITFKEFLDHKISCNRETKRITCTICKKSCARNNYKRHMSSQHGGAPHMCDICGKKFAQSHFAKHRLTHFNDLPFKCTLCPYRGRFSESLKMHMRSHTGEKPYHCEHCPARFINKSNLIRHTRTHTGERKFHCEVCNRGYYTKRDLELHIKVDHMGSREHVCRFCGKAFGYRNKMMKHELKVHKREKAKQKGRTPLYIKVDTMKQQNVDPSLTCSSEKIVNELH